MSGAAPGSAGQKPDPLDRLEQRAYRRAAEGAEMFGKGWIPTMIVSVPDVLALVAVARAARYLIELRKHDRGRYYERTAWKDLDAALALPADDGAATEDDKWFIPEGDRRCGVVHVWAHATCIKRRGHDGPHGTPQGTWIDGPWCDYTSLAEDGAA